MPEKKRCYWSFLRYFEREKVGDVTTFLSFLTKEKETNKV